jgi:DNA polymerase I-like protein with 3'-5' exonuclease and polymerase domains
VQVEHAANLPPDLRAALKRRRAELWDYLGGAALDQPPLDLVASLGVEICTPRTAEEASAMLAEIEADSDANTPAELLRRPGLLGLDLETAALPGMELRPSVKLRRDGVPTKHQPALDNDAGLDPHRSRIRLAQLYGGGRRCLVLDTDLVPLEVLAPTLSRRTAIVHNATFELRFLAAAGIQLQQFEDTVQAAGLLLGVHRRGLDDAAAAYLDVALPKGLQRSDWSAPYLSPGQLAYAAIDAVIAFLLWLKLRVELLSKGRGAAYILQRNVTPSVVRMTARGVLLDRVTHAAQIEVWSAALADARRTFVEEAKQQPPENPNEVRAYLERVLPDTLRAQWPRTADGQMSVRAAELRRVAHLPAIRSLLLIASVEKLFSSFGSDLAAKISIATGRLHPSYNIASAKTGRFSSNNPNVQQLPGHRAPAFRTCIVAPPGRLLVVGDFNMMELRAAAAISNDTAMNADFANGIDLHRRQAADMLGIDYNMVDNEARARAKPVNFSVLYGAGAAGLVATAWTNYGLVLTLAEAEDGRRKFLGRYIGYANWTRLNAIQCAQRGMIVIGRLGRVIEAAWEVNPAFQSSGPVYNHDGDDHGVNNFDDFGPPPQDRNCAQNRLKFTLCCNAPVQGACADAGMLALIKLDAALRGAGIDGGPVLFVHDELVVEVVERQAEQVRDILAQSMEQAFVETFPNAPLNGVVSIGIGKTWGSAKP